MHKKESSEKSFEFALFESLVKTWLPVNRNGWWIKFSTHCEDNILLVFTSMYTAQTIVRYFEDEEEAVKYINFVIQQDPTAEFLYQ